MRVPAILLFFLISNLLHPSTTPFLGYIPGTVDFTYVFTVPVLHPIITCIIAMIDEYNAEENDIKLPDFSTNVLRHTFATRLCSRTADMKAVQYIMGHKDICTTLKYYAEPTDEGIRNSMSSLEGGMF